MVSAAPTPILRKYETPHRDVHSRRGVSGLFTDFVAWVVDLVATWGYPGVFAMMFVESSFVPFPSEVAMIPAGYLASQGQMNAALAIFAGVGGSLCGAVLNYQLALRLGLPALERMGRYVFLKPESLRAAERYFARHGEITTFVARLVPVVRQLISVPAGLARMNVPRFLLYTGLGAGLWSTVLVGLGYVAGEQEDMWRPLLGRTTGWVILGAVLLVGVYAHVHLRRCVTQEP
jgi:membrane protein DedA with SNARE-associated domain